MAIERRIDINTNPSGSPLVTFDPNPLQAKQADQIFWSNHDTQAHWPGLANNQTFFMDFQIAPGSTSTIFSSTVEGTLDYICTLPNHQNETGSIVISKAS